MRITLSRKDLKMHNPLAVEARKRQHTAGGGHSSELSSNIYQRSCNKSALEKECAMALQGESHEQAQQDILSQIILWSGQDFSSLENAITFVKDCLQNDPWYVTQAEDEHVKHEIAQMEQWIEQCEQLTASMNAVEEKTRSFFIIDFSLTNCLHEV